MKERMVAKSINQPIQQTRPDSNWLVRVAGFAIREGWLHITILIGVLATATFLRFWGLRFGLPYFEHPDEWAVADEALRMLRTGNFSPLSYTYPTLYVYLQVGVAALHYAWGATAGIYPTPEAIDPARYYIWARTLTASMGVSLTGLTYLIGRRAYGRTVGLIAALLLAILPTAVGDAHYVTVDTPAAFFMALAFLIILGVRNRWHTFWQIFIAGFVVGLAASTKYTAGVVVMPLFVATVLFYRSSATETQNQPWLSALGSRLSAMIAGVAIGFTIGTPLWLPELPRVLDDLAGIARHYREVGHPGAESSRPALFYWDALHYEAPLVAWATLGGIALALFRRKPADLLILALVIPFMLQLSSVRVVFFRNFVPLMPIVSVLAAAWVAWLVQLVGRQQSRRTEEQKSNRTKEQQNKGTTPLEHQILNIGSVLLFLGSLVLSAQPLAKSLHDEWLRAQPTTRILATDWLLAQAPIGSRIWLEDQTLILPARLRVQGGQPLTTHTPEWYREQGFRFLVVNASLAKSDARKLSEFGIPAAQFEAAGARYGHTFQIYDTGIADVTREPRTPVGATLASGALVLDGYNHTGSVSAVLRLALYWRTERQLEQDYIVFVHLVDSQGTKQAQRDTPPMDGSRPTSTWSIGELIRDDQDLTLPADIAPGTYSLFVGMYDATTFVSINDAGPIAVGTVEVGP
jgi:Dolichyl-phosphate-mannose-protein mannosyltransferase